MSRRRAWNTCASRIGCGKERLSLMSCTLPTAVFDLLHDGNQTTAEEGVPRDGLGVVQTRSIRRTSIVTT